MKTQPLYFEILTVLFLSVIPWPGPSVFKISCPRDRASVVRRIVQKRWIPILKKYQVELPLECPFHESRDIFYPQQAAKHQHRSSQWTCGLCGKSFYTENHLDAHFDNRHKSNINTAEDAVCLADYCDIMRCDVLGNHDFDSSLVDGTITLNTDIQVWRETTEKRVSTPCDSRELSRTYRGEKVQTTSDSSSSFISLQRYCQRDKESLEVQYSENSYRQDVAGPDNKSSACEGEGSDEEEGEDEEDAEIDDDDDDEEDSIDFVEAAHPVASKKRRSKAFKLGKLKASCKPEELQKLKLQCEILVRDCIAGLLANLSLRDFKEVESELNRAVCWYLSCDRYWEDTKKQHRHTPWYLLITFLVLLSASVFGCYYIVWIVFNSAEDSMIDNESRNTKYNHSTDFTTSHYNEPGIHGSGRLDDRRKEILDESLAISGEEMPDHYIYVAYPPDLKRRLLESCYNRTTRL
ncbi:uncharacterized protein LOC122501505 [Leptopilina heterotoma]|uniref:uncharacterized protein LOC122501505 n=1 Tax=Leptopilina heterotoma TaxID=63436 RepID=UPI001CA9B758|nr:uncharacterized protein LOC122501505 [Leptopilina heterotoma]